MYQKKTQFATEKLSESPENLAAGRLAIAGASVRSNTDAHRSSAAFRSSLVSGLPAGKRLVGAIVVIEFTCLEQPGARVSTYRRDGTSLRKSPDTVEP